MVYYYYYYYFGLKYIISKSNYDLAKGELISINFLWQYLNSIGGKYGVMCVTSTPVTVVANLGSGCAIKTSILKPQMWKLGPQIFADKYHHNTHQMDHKI